MRADHLAVSLLALAAAACSQQETISDDGVQTEAGSAPAAVSEPSGPDLSGPDWAHLTSDLPVDGSVVFGELDNGMRYAIKANDNPDGGASIRMRFDDVGQYPVFGGETKSLGHFLEHMAFNGSENVPEGELVRILEREGLSFGADTNASTGLDVTTYILEVPRIETLDTALFLFRETADKILFDPEAIDRERGIIIQESRLRNSPQRRYFRALYDFLLPGSRVGEAIFEDRELVETATREDFLRLYHGFYRPERTMLTVVGDFDPAEVEAMVRETFADFSQPGDPVPAPDIVDVDLPDRPRADLFVDEGLPTRVEILLPALDDASDDVETYDVALEELRRQIAIGVLNRRFATIAEAPGSAILGAGAGAGEQFDELHVAQVVAVTQPDQWREALFIAEQELRRAVEHGFTQAEVSEQLANIRSALETAANAADDRDSGAIANQIVAAYASRDVVMDPRDQLALFNDAEARLTVESIEAAFNGVFAGRAPQIFMSGPVEPEGGAETLLAAYEESRAVTVEAPEESAAGTFAYTDFGPSGEIVERSEIEDLGVVQYRFANNVRLNVKQTDFEADDVRVRVAVSGGTLTQPQAPAYLHTLSGAFIEGGLEAHSQDELRSLLAGVQATRGFSINGDHFAFGSNTTPDDLERALQLLTATLTAPGYRDDALERHRRSVQVQYETQDSTPLGVLSRDLSGLLFGGDPRFGQPAEVEPALEPGFEALRAWLQPALTRNAVEVSIVGDIEPDRAAELVAATLGALPERAAAPESFDRASIASPRSGGASTHAGEPDAAAAVAMWPAPAGGDRQLEATLDLLAAVMNLKATDQVREEAGAAYVAQAGYASSADFPDWGAIFVLSDPEPARIEEVEAIYAAIAGEMREGGVTEDELLRARAPVIENFNQAQEQNGYWLGVIDEAVFEPETLDDHRERLAAVEAVTVADIEDAARRFLTDEAMLTYRVTPQAGE